jgi:hypothetical protein
MNGVVKLGADMGDRDRLTDPSSSGSTISVSPLLALIATSAFVGIVRSEDALDLAIQYTPWSLITPLPPGLILSITVPFLYRSGSSNL